MIDKLLKIFVLFLISYSVIVSFVEYACSGDDTLSRLILMITLALSMISFILYDIDKWKAENNKRRIKEKTLLRFGICGGAWGALIAMMLFRHKINKSYFWFVNIVGAILPMIIIAIIKGDLHIF